MQLSDLSHFRNQREMIFIYDLIINIREVLELILRSYKCIPCGLWLLFRGDA